jgi:hypothetical protein
MLDQTIHVTLPAMHLGAPTVVGLLTLFPIWTDAPAPDVPVPLQPPAGATIGELDSGPAAELLTAKNPTPLPYVLLEGTIVDGGWQHRVLVHSVLVGAAGHPALVEVFEHPDQLAQQWDALIDGLLASTLHVSRKTTSTRRARAFIDRLTNRDLPTLTEAGAGVLGETADDLVSIRALDAGDGRTIHATALNVRHELVLAA